MHIPNIMLQIVIFLNIIQEKMLYKWTYFTYNCI